MTQLSLFLDLPDLTIKQVEVTHQELTLSLTKETSQACCPLCGHASQRVHSRYMRTLQDVPCSGKVLRLLVRVRRFFCTNRECRRKIFAERLPDLTTVYARRTTRCTAALTELGFALGGKAGAHLGASLGLPSNRMTLLRVLRRISSPVEPTPRLLGVDEFAFRRGRTYGTILIDLERGIPIDLLPDKQSMTFALWLKEHPGVQLVSRDRAGEFALGATQGAPEAIQIADRFHLIRNLADGVERLFSQHRKALKQVHLLTAPASSPSLFLHYERPDRERRKQRARTALMERYEAIHQLMNQGVSLSEVARRLHLARGTVLRYARAEQFPERPERPAQSGILAPYESYLRIRFLEGERNGVGLWRELVARGYAGSRMTVERFLLGLRAMEQQGLEIASTATTKPMTPHRVVGLMLRPEEEKTEEEKAALRHVCQLHPDLRLAHDLFESFLQMVRQRRGEELESWMNAAFHSGIAELRSFVNKVRQDQRAVQAGLVLKWNNGVVEGHVNRLKFLKRSMYGRANFDLLRLRVLDHRKCA